MPLSSSIARARFPARIPRREQEEAPTKEHADGLNTPGAVSKDQNELFTGYACAPVQNQATMRHVSGALQRSKSSPPPDLSFVSCCLEGVVHGMPEGCPRRRYTGVYGVQFVLRAGVSEQ